MFFEPIDIPRALNTGTRIKQTDLFYFAGLNLASLVSDALTNESCVFTHGYSLSVAICQGGIIIPGGQWSELSLICRYYLFIWPAGETDLQF